jgi:hypothetical protein
MSAVSASHLKAFVQPLKRAEWMVDTSGISILPSTTAGPRYLSRGPAAFLGARCVGFGSRCVGHSAGLD